MKKILNSRQIKQAEASTVRRQGFPSQALMLSASEGFVNALRKRSYFGCDVRLCILCGTGNNGGEGLAIARLFASFSESVSVLIYRSEEKESARFKRNLALLKGASVKISEWSGGDLPLIPEGMVIDALLGIGLKRPLDGELLRLVHHVNSLLKNVIAVDVPTGMPSDGPFSGEEPALKANEVITFYAPKLSFFFPESERIMQRFEVVNVDLDFQYIHSLPFDYSLIEASDITGMYRRRSQFSHKGTYGKALIVAGTANTLGAALLCAEACLHAGAGLTTVCIPEESRIALNIRCPEAMFVSQEELEERWDEFTVVGIGPGLGDRSELVGKLLALKKKPMLLDADALLYLARHPEAFLLLAEHTILTPHMKEFDRLFGVSDSWNDRLLLARKKAKEHQLIIVLKNRYTFIVLPNGEVRINPTGNPGMASGGMGDALSGIITALLAQGYSPEEAAVLGVYVHGSAGDDLVLEKLAVVSASQVIAKIPFVLHELDRNVPE